jgi:hypothetical protein
MESRGVIENLRSPLTGGKEENEKDHDNRNRAADQRRLEAALG